MFSTPITLDRERNLRYDMKALSFIEKKLEIKIANMDVGGLSIEGIAVFVWAGLMHEDDSLSVVKVMDLIDRHSNLKKIMKAAAKAFSAAFAEDGEDEVKNG